MKKQITIESAVQLTGDYRIDSEIREEFTLLLNFIVQHDWAFLTDRSFHFGTTHFVVYRGGSHIAVHQLITKLDNEEIWSDRIIFVIEK